VRIPDSDRWLLGVGAGYQLTRSLALDFAYLHVFFDDGTVNETAQVLGSPMIQGTYSNGTADLLALQVTYNFDHLTDLYHEVQSAMHG